MKHEVYRRLQQHLDTHPVGFAASEDDSDVRLLAKIFTPEQAELACRIGWHHESTREIYAKATDLVASEDELSRKLHEVLENGGVSFRRRGDEETWAIVPLVLGMYEYQAELACRIGWHHESTREIYAKATDLVASEDELSRKLHEVLENGGVSFRRRGDEEWWAIVPLVLGMYEYQVGRLSPRLLLALRDYWQSPKTGERRDGSEGVPREEPPGQMRVIPIGASVTPDLTVGTFDEISHLVDEAGDRIALLPCVCRRHHAMLGQACERTAREESCMAFLDWADHAVEQGVGRPISREEALEALAASQREGLVLMPSNSKEAQFVCSCCPDCCGVLTGLRRSERPADRARSSRRTRWTTSTSSTTRCGRRAAFGLHAHPDRGRLPP